MIYIQLDVNFRDHQRVMEACEDIEDRTARAEKRFAIYGLFAAGLSYCQEKCLKGWFPKTVAEDVLGGTPDLISRLLRVGLWIEDAGKYWIRNFEAKNQTPEQIEKRKQAAKERKERFKSKKNTPGNANGTRSERVPSGVGVGVGVNDLSSEEGSGEEPSEEAPRASGAMGFAASSWVEGVRSVTKGRPTLAWWERRDIEDLARDRPQDVGAAEWGRAEGEAFAKRQKACKPPPQVTAKNYLAWVGDGRPPPFDRSLRVAGPIVDEAAERKRIDREQRDRAYLHRKMVDEAAPMPVELLKVLGVTGAAG